MTASAEQIARLRRMVAEPTETTYDDEALAAAIERYPRLDERGEAPYTWDATTSPPTQTENTAWIATYDLNAAAGEVWEEKAAALAGSYDATADGTTLHVSQAYQQALGQARYFKARRTPTTMTAQAWPKQVEANVWIANLPEVDPW